MASAALQYVLLQGCVGAPSGRYGAVLQYRPQAVDHRVGDPLQWRGDARQRQQLCNLGKHLGRRATRYI